MYSINTITAKDIERLDASLLTQLLNKLLYLEAYKHNFTNYKILVPENITVGDGGEDGRFTLDNMENNSSRWLKSNFIIFQCKATDLGPSACRKEVIESESPSIKLKNSLIELNQNNSSYILFTNSSYNQKMITAREKEFKQAFKDCGYNNVNIEIYDANKIRDWVNEYLPAVVFIQETLRQSRNLTFQTWDNIRKNGSYDKRFFSDSKLDSYIIKIRENITTQQIQRVIGHSGLGKTKLVLESFNTTNNSDYIKKYQEAIVYYDLGLGNFNDLNNFIRNNARYTSAVLIVDNCTGEYHDKLKHIIDYDDYKNLKLITIDNVINDNNKYDIILKREDCTNVVKCLVEELMPQLDNIEKGKIIEYCEGYPYMAKIISKSFNTSDRKSLTSIGDIKSFLEKLLGKKARDVEYKVIEICALFSDFGFLDNKDINIVNGLSEEQKGNLEKDVLFITEKIYNSIYGEIKITDFNDICSTYKEQGLLEQRGTRIMVKPTPLAIYLTKTFLDKRSYSDFNTIIRNEISNHPLGLKLVERLSHLDESNQAQHILSLLITNNGPFSSAEMINTHVGSLLFRNIAHVNPVQVMEVLENEFGNMTNEALLNIKVGRRNLVWTLEKLAFRKETFHSAVRLLLKFAIAENENISNNSQGVLVQLLQPYNAGTEVNLKERIKFLHSILEENKEEYTNLILIALDSLLSTYNYSRMIGMEEQGARLPLRDYVPSRAEVKEYYSAIFDILASLATNNSIAEKVIIQSINQLVGRGFDNKLFNFLRNRDNLSSNIKLDIYHTLVDIQQYNRVDFRDEVIQSQFEALIEYFKPQDMETKLSLLITNPIMYKYEADGSTPDPYKKNLAELESFIAELIGEKHNSWKECISTLLSGHQQLVFDFGNKFALALKDKNNIEEIISIINLSLQTLKTISEDKQNIQFIYGLLIGLGDEETTRNIIQEISNDNILHLHVFSLIQAINIKYEDLENLFSIINEYALSITSLRRLDYYKKIIELSIEEQIKFFETFISYGQDGIITAIMMISALYRENDKILELSPILEQLVLHKDLLEILFSLETSAIYNWSIIIKKLVIDNTSFAKDLIIFIIELITSNTRYTSLGEEYIYEILEILFDRYFDITWSYISEIFAKDDRDSWRLLNILTYTQKGAYSSISFLFENKKYCDAIIELCKLYPDSLPELFAIEMPLMTAKADTAEWHPFALSIIDNFHNNPDILVSIYSNFNTRSYIGSLVPYYEKDAALISQLIDHQSSTVSKWAKKMLREIQRNISREKLRDAERYL